MNDQKHTPGPWTRESGTRHIKIWGSKPQTGCKLIAEVRNEGTECSTSGQEELANARLIAAAPDLLEALERIMDDMGSQIEYMTPFSYVHAKGAIAKANGEPHAADPGHTGGTRPAVDE